MAERGCTFVEDGVEIEIRGDILHIGKGKVGYAIPLSAARKLNRTVAAAIAMHDHAPSNVVSMCAGCERLPGH